MCESADRDGGIVTLDNTFEHVERLHERRRHLEAVPQGVARHGIALLRDLLAKLRLVCHGGIFRRPRR